MGEKKEMTMEQDLRGWGVGLLIMGGLHFVIPIFAREWGFVLIPLGLLSLFVRRRGMFIVIGLSLIFVGLLNIVASLKGGTGFWPVYGGLQIYWGIKEIAKFEKYGRLETQDPLSLEAEAVNLESVKKV